MLDAFENGEDLYCATASQMFHVPVVKHGVNGELRQKGKIATLACGYGGSSGALISMGALQMGLKEEELPEIIDSWREANPKIVQYWWDVEEAAMEQSPDLLHFEKGIYCAFIETGLAKGDEIEYKTNFGVTLTSYGNRRTMTSFLGFKKGNTDGTITLVDAPYRVYDNSIQYRRYMKKRAKDRLEAETA